MTNTTEALNSNEDFVSSDMKVKKHLKITEINYNSNSQSNYTEKIKDLDKGFDYSSNSNYYWSEPELSTLYGTPLYEQASFSQRIALNHVYWAGQYNQTAATEANAVLYNQVTSRVFSSIGGYETLCKELELETDQERHHIHAFQKIGYKTKMSLLGKAALGNPLYKKSKHQFLKPISFHLNNSQLISLQDSTLRFITNMMIGNEAHSYSLYLKDLDKEGNNSIPAQAGGLVGISGAGSQMLVKFFTLNWASSPFLACQYYVTRFMANMLLKNYEHRYSLYFKELEKKGEFIPIPTAVSRYHLLDESFHTTTSQLIAKDLYKDFPKPTAYEKFVANLGIYLAQRNTLSGLSGGIVGIFRDDASLMLLFYRLLQSPIIGMSAKEAFHWMEKCLCQEHDGFHVNLKYHQHLLSNFLHAFDDLDFLWPINREMRVMASGGSIDEAVQRNIKSFKQFSKSVTS